MLHVTLRCEEILDIAEGSFLAKKLNTVKNTWDGYKTLVAKEDFFMWAIGKGYIPKEPPYILEEVPLASLGGCLQPFSMSEDPQGRVEKEGDAILESSGSNPDTPHRNATGKHSHEDITNTEDEIVRAWQDAQKNKKKVARYLDCALTVWLRDLGKDGGNGKREVLAGKYKVTRQTINEWTKRGISEGKLLLLPPLE